MGLISALLTLPLAPVRGAVWVAEQVAEEADRQLYDEQRIRAELMLLEIEAEEHGLTDTEIQSREEELIQRLAVAQARRQATRGNAMQEGDRNG